MPPKNRNLHDLKVVFKGGITYYMALYCFLQGIERLVGERREESRILNQHCEILRTLLTTKAFNVHSLLWGAVRLGRGEHPHCSSIQRFNSGAATGSRFRGDSFRSYDFMQRSAVDSNLRACNTPFQTTRRADDRPPDD